MRIVLERCGVEVCCSSFFQFLTFYLEFKGLDSSRKLCKLDLPFEYILN